MKKLTKCVKAGGLWFDVPLNTTHVSADSFGMIKAHTAKPINTGMESWLCPGFDDFVCYFDLEGADWHECCWYVGDQVDGEDAKSREWMARGVDDAVDSLSRSGAFTFGDCLVVVATHAAKIRAGEVEL